MLKRVRRRGQKKNCKENRHGNAVLRVNFKKKEARGRGRENILAWAREKRAELAATWWAVGDAPRRPPDEIGESRKISSGDRQAKGLCAAAAKGDPFQALRDSGNRARSEKQRR